MVPNQLLSAEDDRDAQLLTFGEVTRSSSPEWCMYRWSRHPWRAQWIMFGAPVMVKSGRKSWLTNRDRRYQILLNARSLWRVGSSQVEMFAQWLNTLWRREGLVQVLCTQPIVMKWWTWAVAGAYPCPSTQNEDVGKYFSRPLISGWYREGMVGTSGTTTGQNWHGGCDSPVWQP